MDNNICYLVCYRYLSYYIEVPSIFINDFLRFASFYGFKPQVYNVYLDHAIGNMKNKVGYIKYNFINPALVIKNLNHLTQLLERQLNTAHNLIHYDKRID